MMCQPRCRQPRRGSHQRGERALEEISEDVQGELEGQGPGSFVVSKQGLPMRGTSRGSKSKK